MSLTGNKTLIDDLRKKVARKFPQVLTSWDEYIPVSTGIHLLDNGFLRGGLPTGQLVEIVGSKSSGKTSLLLKTLYRFSQEERIVAYFDYSSSFYPPSAKKIGINLNQILVLKPQSIQAGLRAAEILFRNGCIGVAVFDLVGIKDKIPKTLLLRLKRNVRQSGGIAIFLREPDSSILPRNQIALCLKVEKINQKLLVIIEKSLFKLENDKVEVPFNA